MTRTQYRKRLGAVLAWLEKRSKDFAILSKTEHTEKLRGVYEGKAESYRMFTKAIGCIVGWVDSLNSTGIGYDEVLLFCIKCDSGKEVDLYGDDPVPLCKKCKAHAEISHELAV